jgi:hypothetical protein
MKDVEREFGILVAQFAIMRGPARFWYIMTACVIMHTMIINDDHGKDVDYSFF